MLRLIVLLVVFSLGCSLAESARSAPPQAALDINPQDVEKSIRGAVSFLYSQNDGDSWPEWGAPVGGMGEFPGGLTALAVLALINAGESPDDERIARALRFLETTPREESRSTYAVSLRVMAFAAADPKLKRYRNSIENDVRWLIESQNRQEPSNVFGGWSYEDSGRHGFGADPSNSQFAILALNDAVQLGITVDSEVWKMADAYWQGKQPNLGGGWGYVFGSNPSGSMTCAGVASSIIVEDNLIDPNQFLTNGMVDCCQTIKRSSRIQNGIKWLSNRFSVSGNPGTGFGNNSGNSNKYYYLYGLERASRLAGIRFYGNHDWYREGIAHLLNQQNRDQSFSEANEKMTAIRDTAFALLFMAKGLRPIVFGKYQYSDVEETWDLHPGGIHFLTRETEKAWDIPINWQTIRGLDATANDLREAPILFFSGREAIKLNDDQKRAIKNYVENGGFVFAEACQGNGCGENVPFDRSFRELMKELFPESSFEPLKPDHAVWTSHFQLKPDPDRPLLGLQACCRTSVIFCPKNLSCFWQLDRPAFLAQLPAKVKTEIEECRKIGINVAAYATGRDLKHKLETPKIEEKLISVLENQVLTFPKLSHNGGSDEAPNAWKNAQTEFVMRTNFDASVEKKMVPLAFDDKSSEMANYPVLFMHGRTSVSFSPQERQALKKYMELGNLLLVDSICSSQDFSDSFKKEIDLIFPGELQPIKGNHSIWTKTYGYDLNAVTLRTPDTTAALGFRTEVSAPKMLGVEKDGRLVLVFSPNDLSCALEKAAANQCRGYTQEDAFKITTNVLLYALWVK